MDNCFLEKLLAKPGKLYPKYNKTTFNYNIILSVSDSKTTLDFYTEESGASYQIFTEGGDGTKTINVDEGKCKTVKIEVTAEDGKTTKCYVIDIKRHSAKVAILESIKTAAGKLQPIFDSNVFEYFAVVGLKVINIDFILQTPDQKCKTKINNEEIKSAYSLTLGHSLFNINVTSPDGSHNQTYKITIIRKSFPHFILISDPQYRFMYEDSISLSPSFHPVRLNSMYSWDILSKYEAEQLINLKHNDFEAKLEIDQNLEIAISNLDGQFLNPNLTLSESVKINNLGSLKLNSSDTNLSTISYSFYPFNDNINTTPEWQQNLCLTNCNDNDKKLIKNCEEAVKIYLQCRPNKPVFNINQTINHEHPSKKLFNAISLAATAIIKQKSESKYHFMLAQLLEENYTNEDVFNLILHKMGGSESDNNCLVKCAAGQDFKAVNSAKLDEILAICKLHGYGNNPTDTEQLMALDKEYHSLLSQNQTGRADAIQNLYEWKSKQSSQEATMSSQALNEETLFGQIFNKYLAALSLDKKSSLYNFHVGRLLIIQGKYKEAIERLHTALNGKSNHSASKLCLGLAMSFMPDLIKEKITESVFLIYDSLVSGLHGIFDNAYDTDNGETLKDKLFTDEDKFFDIRNPLISKAILQLGCLLMKTPQTKVSIKSFLVIHWALHFATLGWCEVGNGNTLLQFESIIIECHKQLLLLLHEEMDNVPDAIYVNRCLWLMNFIRSSSIPINRELLKLLEELSQVPLYFEPENSYYLTCYGEILSTKADQMIANDETFISAIELSIKILTFALDIKRNKKAYDAIKFIKDQIWHKEKRLLCFQLKPQQEKGKVLDKKGPEANKSVSSAQTAAKGTNTKPPPITQKKIVSQPPKKGSVKQGNVPSKNVVAPKDKQINTVVESKEESENTTGNVDKAIFKYQRNLANGTTLNPYRIELSLARAYRINKQFVESVKYYKISGIENYLQTINDMMQEYVETLISAQDYETALAVYYKFNINDKNPSFDDGYICGEVVRLLMKLEKYQDKMLVKYASLWAKIFGLGIIEKEIKILEDKSQTDTCKEIYANVNGKKVDDPDLKFFFQSRCWI